MNAPALTFSLEAEQALLGAMMMDPACSDRIDVALTAKSFYREDHRRIFGAIRALQVAGKSADIVAVADELQKADELERAGGFAYLAELTANTVSSATAPRHAEIIAERALRREAMAVADEIAQIVTEPGRTGEEVVDFAQAKVMALSDKNRTRFTPVKVKTALIGCLKRLQSRGETEDWQCLPIGFADLDARLNGGLRPGQLVIIAARPGMGKTAIAMQMALYAASRGFAALFCSQEMEQSELSDRALSLESGVPLGRVLTGKLSEEDYSLVTAALGRIAEYPLWIDEQPALTLLDVRNKARRVQRENGKLDLLVVDYLQLMSGGGETRNDEIGKISRGLKSLAKEMAIPVIALSQLSRKCEERPNKRPVMSDLRDSGAIEQDADIIMFVYRDEVYRADSIYAGLAELHLAKCRNGKAGGFIPLRFRGETTRFDSMYFSD